MHTSSPLAELQAMARRLGVLFTILAAAMSGYAGIKFGGDSLFAQLILGALLAGLTIATAIMLNFIDAAWSAGERTVAAVLAGMFAVLAMAEYGSHVAFGTSHRAVNIERAAVQNARYDDAREQISEGKASLDMWASRLAKLESENAWAATVTADALRAQEQAESRRGGCGSKCLEIRAKIAIAEETGTLRKQIEATRAVLAKHRERAATTERGDSVAHNQSQLFATAATGSLVPSAQAIAWANIGIGAYIALISTMLGTLFNWLGFHTFNGSASRGPASTEPASDGRLAQAIRDAIKTNLPVAA